MTDCIEWDGALNAKGYGVHRIPGEDRTALAHRTAFEAFFGSIPSGMFVCHTCDNPACYNPLHLFLGTARDNNVDMSLKGRNSKQRITHCPSGHEYTEANTYLLQGRRYCRSCNNARSRRHR